MPNFHIRVYGLSHSIGVAECTDKRKHAGSWNPEVRCFHVRDFGLVEVRFLSPDYAFEECDGTLTPTGRLDIFRLSARDPSLPGFAARWDGGNRYGHEQFDLDIDMVNVGDVEIAKPTGHHRYEVTITTPLGVVFDATCSFTLHRQVTVKAAARVGAMLRWSAHLPRASTASGPATVVATGCRHPYEAASGNGQRLQFRAAQRRSATFLPPGLRRGRTYAGVASAIWVNGL